MSLGERVLQERGLLLVLGLAVLASGGFVFADLRELAPSLTVEPIVLQDTTVLLPTFVPVGPVDVNRASVEELTALTGIGPALAARIVAYREENGPFSSVDELECVQGIGPQTVKGLEEEAVALPIGSGDDR